MVLNCSGCSSEEGMTDPRLFSTSALPDGHGEELMASCVVPAVFGSVFAPNNYDSTYETVPQMELLTLEGVSGVHPDNMVVRLDGTAAVRDNHETSGPASLFIAVARPYDCGSDSPDFLDTGDPTPTRAVYVRIVHLGRLMGDYCFRCAQTIRDFFSRQAMPPCRSCLWVCHALQRQLLPAPLRWGNQWRLTLAVRFRSRRLRACHSR